MNDRITSVWTHRARTNVPHPALLHHVVQRLHDLLPGRIPVQSVDLQHIDVCPQTLDALLHSIEDMLARQTNLVHELAVVCRHRRNAERRVILIDSKVALGQQHDLGARDVVLLQRLSDDALACAVRVDVRLHRRVSALVLRNVLGPNAQCPRC